MSYILEALKKSEKERALGNIPTLGTTNEVQQADRPFWFGVIIGICVLALIFVLGWLAKDRWFSTITPTPLSSTSSEQTEEPVQQKADEEVSEEPEISSVASNQPVESVDSDNVNSVPVLKRVDSVDELDTDAQKKLSDLAVSVVSFSQDPERRFVMLNQRIVREGSTLPNQVIVKEITPKGVILEVDGYEFLMRPN